MRVALYARYSSDLQDRRSISDQLYEARAFAARQGWTVVAEISEPETSASLPLSKRPVLLSLMERAEAREFDVVLAEDIDRLARRQSVMHALAEHLDFCEVGLWTLRDGQVSDLHVTFKGHVAADFLKGLGQKVRRGHAGRVREGRPPAGRPPYGYRLVKGEIGKREIAPEEAAITRRIVDCYLAGMSSPAIVKMLNAEGVPGPGGPGCKWTRNALTGSRTRCSGIFRNPAYAGGLVYGRRSQPRNPQSGRHVSRCIPEDQWTLSEDPTLAIIEPEKWQRVQVLLASRAHLQPREQRRPRHLLSGLLVCGVCDQKFTVMRYTKGRIRVPYFACRFHDSGCSNHRMVRGPEIERRVLDALRQQLLSPEAIELAVRVFREEKARTKAERAKMRDSTERELADVRRQLRNVRAAIRDVGHSRSLLQDLTELEARERTLEAKLPTTEPEVVELHPQAAQRYRAVVEDLGKALTGPEPARARAMTLLRSLITRVVVIPTPSRTPVDLEVVGDLLGLLTIDGTARRDAASQVASIAIRA
jgi:DNA invertase Pin-like site-specific DNA recombinase